MAAERPSIRAHFLDPLPQGEPEGTWGVGRAQNAACGDDLELFTRVDHGGRLELSYRARGCSALRAAASLAVEVLRGAPLAQAQGFDAAACVAAAGGLPPHKAHAPRMVERALREALADPRTRCHP